ncbi:hypothetical protein SDC9_77615 [bioreactor metagenome]|uniref:Uncharacterized protein n=1 Tax=bioreactor metagenome TaxID=1076179 RepID=A0A644YR42_9ZZZZ
MGDVFPEAQYGAAEPLRPVLQVGKAALSVSGQQLFVVVRQIFKNGHQLLIVTLAAQQLLSVVHDVVHVVVPARSDHGAVLVLRNRRFKGVQRVGVGLQQVRKKLIQGRLVVQPLRRRLTDLIQGTGVFTKEKEILPIQIDEDFFGAGFR